MTVWKTVVAVRNAIYGDEFAELAHERAPVNFDKWQLRAAPGKVELDVLSGIWCSGFDHGKSSRRRPTARAELDRLVAPVRRRGPRRSRDVAVPHPLARGRAKI